MMKNRPVVISVTIIS